MSHSSFSSAPSRENEEARGCSLGPGGVAYEVTAIHVVGKLYGEAEMLALAKTYQDATDHHNRHPTL